MPPPCLKSPAVPEASAPLNARPLALVGAGRMGVALLKGWQAADPAREKRLLDPAPSQAVEALAAASASVVLSTAPSPDLFASVSTLILAVKPQVMGDVLQALPRPAADTLVLSVAAGLPLAFYESHFGVGRPIIRAMPNTPAAIGQGITALVANGAAGQGRDAGPYRAEATALLSAVGQVVWLDAEAQMDGVTAVSGSGPAYVFHFIEALAAAAEAEGLAPELAMALARQTVTGAGALAGASAEPPAALREAVTSPGGTTAAGLDVLMGRARPDAPSLTALVTETVAAAAQRSRALGKG